MILLETNRPIYSNLNGDDDFTPLKPRSVLDQIPINSEKPILIPTKPLTQVQQNIVNSINSPQKASWWSKQSKTNKALIIVSSISIITILSYMIVSKKK